MNNLGENKIDYSQIIFWQIVKCNNSEPDDLYEDVTRLILLCRPFSDEKFEQDASSIKEELEDAKFDDENEVFHIAGMKYLDACISLLKRVGVIETK